MTYLHQRGGGTRDANALILATDGEKNDDPTGGATLDDVIDHLRGRSQVHVFLLVFGPAACGSPAFTTLTDRTDTVCLDAGESGLDRAFEQVSATLWGTDRP